jgi:hypothetical protein
MTAPLPDQMKSIGGAESVTDTELSPLLLMSPIAPALQAR